MLSKIFSSDPVVPQQGVAVLRIITGLLMAYHGWEVFNPELINGYAAWDAIKILPAPLFMAYLGKGLELVTGVLLSLVVHAHCVDLYDDRHAVYLLLYRRWKILL